MDETQHRCICRRSYCVQRYCSCFDGGYYCSEHCFCICCRNTHAYEGFVEERVELARTRRSGASKSKIEQGAGSSSSEQGQEQRRHVKACTCTKSRCAKNYCECVKNKVACTARCQCKHCANSHGARDGAKQPQEDGDPGGASGDSNGTSDGLGGSPGSANGSPDAANGSHGSSKGPSNGSSVVTEEDPSDLDGMLLLGDLNNLHNGVSYQNAHPQTNQ